MKVDKEIRVQNINNFYFALREEVQKNNQIILDFSDTVIIDASAVQVIQAAEKKIKDLGKSIRFTGLSFDIANLLQLAGIKLQ